MKCLLFFFLLLPLYADSLGDDFKHIGDEIVSQATMLGKGFASMGGSVGKSQIYSYRVFNGLPEPVLVENKSVKSVLGANFHSGTGTSMTVPAGGDSGDTFYKSHLYFYIKIPACDFSESHCKPTKPNDSTVYGYHTYQSATVNNQQTSIANHVENVGEVFTTSAFSSMIYNGASTSQSVSFCLIPGTKTSSPLYTTVPVEPDTYTVLTAPEGGSLRPSTLTLQQTKILIPAQGLGTQTVSGSGKNQQKVVYPSRYNYEILSSGKAIETGITPGNYRQPVNGKVRDITPIQVFIWNQDAQSAFSTNASDTSSTAVPFYDDNYTLWVAYDGQIILNNGTVKNNAVLEVPYGKCLSFFMVRPSVEQAKSCLYCMRLSTKDTLKAQNFLQKCMATEFPSLSLQMQGVTNNLQLTPTLLLQAQLPTQVGYLSYRGVTGIVMGLQYFSCYDISAYRSFYATVSLPTISLSMFISEIQKSMETSTDDTGQSLPTYQTVLSWHTAYTQAASSQDLEIVEKKIADFLLSYGQTSLYTIKGTTKTLNQKGLAVLSSLLYGPISISRLPLSYQLMQSNYQQAPSVWVDQENIVYV